MKPTTVVALYIFGVLAIVAGGLIVVFMPFLQVTGLEDHLAVAGPHPARAPARQVAEYLKPIPGDAPPEIRDEVGRGYEIVRDTRGRLPEHVGNTLGCNNCHFSAGLTDGGKNHGLSLVGSAAHYRASPDGARGLEAQVDACFRTNLNAVPPSSDSHEMRALLAYLDWISAGVPLYADIPWLGLKPLTGTEPADPTRGRAIYQGSCIDCHGDHGQGSHFAPALWGPDSFTAQSGMLAPGFLERFIDQNMPRGNPNLEAMAAVNVAALVRSQSRPEAKAQ